MSRRSRPRWHGSLRQRDCAVGQGGTATCNPCNRRRTPSVNRCRASPRRPRRLWLTTSVQKSTAARSYRRPIGRVSPRQCSTVRWPRCGPIRRAVRTARLHGRRRASPRGSRVAARRVDVSPHRTPGLRRRAEGAPDREAPSAHSDGRSSQAPRADMPAGVIAKTRRRRPSVSRVSVTRPRAPRRGGSLYRRVCGNDQKFPSVALTCCSRSYGVDGPSRARSPRTRYEVGVAVPTSASGVPLT